MHKIRIFPPTKRLAHQPEIEFYDQLARGNSKLVKCEICAKLQITASYGLTLTKTEIDYSIHFHTYLRTFFLDLSFSCIIMRNGQICFEHFPV